MRHVIQRSITPKRVLTLRLPRNSLVAAAMAGLFVGDSHTQTQPNRPAFEVASIKPNANCAGGRGGGNGMPPPGRIQLSCADPRMLVQIAYGMFADGVTQSPRKIQVLGGPGWVDTDTYDVAATAEGNPRIGQMYGPMLQTLLEDRFKLKVHKESRELPVYVLTVDKSGSKLQPTKPGSCTPIDLSHLPPPPERGQAAPTFCGRGSIQRRGGNTIVDMHGATIASFAGSSLPNSDSLDRPVVDATGLSGIFDFHLEFASENSASGGRPAASSAADLADASIFTAIREQLGLKLSPGKAPVEVLVIDRIERPSGN